MCCTYRRDNKLTYEYPVCGINEDDVKNYVRNLMKQIYENCIEPHIKPQ
jgi:hypothetical protein